MALPEISVITATYNRAGLLLQKLESLKVQTLGPSAFEWIVCVNGSTDKTREIFKDVQVPFDVKVIDFQANQGVSKGRNACVKEVQGSVLYFSDDDCILQRDTLEHHLRAQKHPCVAIGGIRFEAETVSLWQPKRVAYWNLNGANSSMPKQAFEAVGGFDEHLSGYGGEDVLLGYQLSQQGLKFQALEGWVTHLGPNPMRGKDLAKAKSAGRNAMKIAAFHPELAFRMGVDARVLALKKLALYGPLGYVWKLLSQDSFRYERAYLEGALEEKYHV